MNANTGAESTADTLLFIAQAFFLPAQSKPKIKLYDPSVKSMNKHLDTNHPWVEFNRSLAALSTLHASKNNVFAVMLQVLPEDAPKNENDDFLDINNITAARFLCADNWDEGKAGELRGYITESLRQILEASEKAGEQTNPESEFNKQIKQFIEHVYRRGWEKFKERMTKTDHRVQRLVDVLEDENRKRIPKPARLPHLIEAMNSVLNMINTGTEADRDYVAIHNACTRVREEAFYDGNTKRWIIGLADANIWVGEGATAFRILKKMVKTRNSIETLIRLIKDPNMKPTFQALARAENLTIWVPSGPQSPKGTPIVDLSNTNKYNIMKTYTDTISAEDEGTARKYANAGQVWKRISDNVVNVKLPPKQRRVKDSRTKFEIDGEHLQHCEGKLLRYVIQEGLLGKVFPYIGCGKLCCEPCFTAIAAVNELIDNAKMSNGDRLHFAADGTHRKIYSGFGITLIEKDPFETAIFLKTFNKLLSRDIGLVTKAGLKKCSGGSDSDP